MVKVENGSIAIGVLIVLMFPVRCGRVLLAALILFQCVLKNAERTGVGTCPGHVQDLSGTFPGHTAFLEISRSDIGQHFQDT